TAHQEGNANFNSAPDVSETFQITNVPVITHTLTYIAGANGTITGTLSQIVTMNGDGTAVTVVADSGFHFVNWSPDGSTINPRTDLDVTADISVTANFAQNPA